MQNRIELYKQTEEVLYTAYFDDTLKHGDCTACAVGNICVAASNRTGVDNHAWNVLFMTDSDRMVQTEFKVDAYADEKGVVNAYRLVNATGYDKRELMAIEWAFESAAKGESAEGYMFNGLVAVLEVLKDIHGITEEDIDLGRFQKVHAGRVSTV